MKIPEHHFQRITAVCRKSSQEIYVRPLSEGWIGFAKSFCGSLFPSILEALREEKLEWVHEEIEIAVLSLMAILGPQTSQDLPAAVCRELLKIIDRSPASKYNGNQIYCAVGFTLAYAAGWGRTGQTGDTDWDGTWPGVAQARPLLERRCTDAAAVSMIVQQQHPRNLKEACHWAVKSEVERVDGDLKDYCGNHLFPEGLRTINPVDGKPVDMDPDDLAVVTLMTLLGPLHPVCPPMVLCENLFQHVIVYALVQPEKNRMAWIVQLTLAYANAWGRSVDSGRADWDAPWSAAIHEMTAIIIPLIRSAYRWISGLVQLVDPLNDSFKSMDPRDAMVIALTFAGRIPEENGTKTARYQSIRTWDPLKSQLYYWTNIAVTGAGVAQRANSKEAGHNSYATGSFEGSLLYEVLQDDRRIELWQVAYQMICECDAASGIDVGDRDSRRYAGGWCASGEHRVAIVAEKHLVIPGISAVRSFRKCIDSDPEHYMENGSKRHPVKVCPLCGGKPSERVTVMLVRDRFGMDPAGGVPPEAKQSTLPIEPKDFPPKSLPKKKKK